MTAKEFKEIRKFLGLSIRDLSLRLRLGGNGQRNIMRYERGEADITGPVSVAMEQFVEIDQLKGALIDFQYESGNR